MLQIIDGRGGKGRNRTLHVGGAPAIEQAVLDFGGKGLVLPVGLVAHRHHVGMAGKTQMRFGRADAGEKIFNVGRVLVLEDQALADKAVGTQQVFKHGERTALMGGDGAAADQVLENCDGIGGGIFHGGQHSGKKYVRPDWPDAALTKLKLNPAGRCHTGSALRCRAGNRIRPGTK